MVILKRPLTFQPFPKTENWDVIPGKFMRTILVLSKMKTSKMEEEAREEGEGGREGKVVVVGLIEKATNSTRPEVDPRLLKAIKSAVRYSDSELRLAAQTLTSLMKRDHSQVLHFSLYVFIFFGF